MARSAYQYQPLAEPVFVPAGPGLDNVPLDRWFQPTPSAVRGRSQSSRFLAEWLFWHSETPAPPLEEITLDKWFRALEEPIRIRPRAADFTASFHRIAIENLAIPDLSWGPIFPDYARGRDQSTRFLAEWLSWYTETPAPPSEPDRQPASLGATRIVFGRRRQYEAYASPVFVPDPLVVFQPSTLEWLSKYPDRTYGKPPFRHQGRHQYFTPRLPELAGWWQQASEPRFKRYTKQQPLDWTISPPSFLPVIRPIQLDDWWQPTQEPVRTAPRWVFTHPTRGFQPDMQPEPRADGWLRHWPEPTRRVPTANHQWLYDPLPAPFEILPPPPPVPDINTWFQPPPDFARGRVPTYLLGPYVFWYTETGPNTAISHKPKFSMVIRHKRRH